MSSLLDARQALQTRKLHPASWWPTTVCLITAAGYTNSSSISRGVYRNVG